MLRGVYRGAYLNNQEETILKTVLFQGDSITDCYRLRDNDKADEDNFLGMGYPTLVKGRLGLDNPNEYKFLNRAYSGDRIVDVYARHKRDIINHSPDYMSLLVGVNDVWHEVDEKNGVDPVRFEQLYRMLLDDLFAALPGLKVMLMEPFFLPGSGTENCEEKPARGDTFAREVPLRAEIVKKIAKDYKLEFVSLQHEISAAASIAGNSAILIDGVHPSAIGHEIIAREWMKHFEKIRG